MLDVVGEMLCIGQAHFCNRVQQNVCVSSVKLCQNICNTLTECDWTNSRLLEYVIEMSFAGEAQVHNIVKPPVLFFCCIMLDTWYTKFQQSLNDGQTFRQTVLEICVQQVRRMPWRGCWGQSLQHKMETTPRQESNPPDHDAGVGDKASNTRRKQFYPRKDQGTTPPAKFIKNQESEVGKLKFPVFYIMQPHNDSTLLLMMLADGFSDCP